MLWLEEFIRQLPAKIHVVGIVLDNRFPVRVVLREHSAGTNRIPVTLRRLRQFVKHELIIAAGAKG